MVMAVKIVTDSEFVNLCYQLLQPIALDKYCEAVGWGPLVKLVTVRSNCLVIIALLRQYNDLEFENKLEISCLVY